VLFAVLRLRAFLLQMNEEAVRELFPELGENEIETAVLNLRQFLNLIIELIESNENKLQ
jgi:hypothetical protein